MRLIAKIKAYSAVMKQRQAKSLDHIELLRKRPALLAAVSGMELGQMVSGRLEPRLKALAQIKTSALIGCPF